MEDFYGSINYLITGLMAFSSRHTGYWMQLSIFLSSLLLTSAEYACICSRGADSPLYVAPDPSSVIIGYLYEFDCQPQYAGLLGLAGSWNAVFINHQIAYIEMTPSLLRETCHGDLPDEDKLTTGPIVPSSTTVGPSTTSSSTSSSSSRTTSHTEPSTTSTMPTTFTTNASARECPSSVRYAARRNHGNTSVYGTTCYELVPYKYSWQYAENNCKHKGGHLVHIRDIAEENNVLQFLSDNSYLHDIWIGLSDSDSELTFQWSSGDPVTFTEWKTGYDMHHTLHHIMDCVLLAPSFNRYGIYGEWDDAICTAQHSWVCQYDAVPARPTTTQSTTTASSNYNYNYHHHGGSSNNQGNNNNNNYNYNQNQSSYSQNSHGYSGSDHHHYYNTYTTTKSIKDYFLDLIG